MWSAKNSMGRSGGMITLWNPDMFVSLHSFEGVVL